MSEPKSLSERPIPAEFMARAAGLRNAVIWQSNSANEVIARALMAEHDNAEHGRGCTCLEVYGEDPACPIHGRGTEWAKANPDIAELAEKAAQSDAKDARIAELTALLTNARTRTEAVVASWDERGGGDREQFKPASGGLPAYWSPRAGMVDSEAIAGLRALASEIDAALHQENKDGK